MRNARAWLGLMVSSLILGSSAVGGTSAWQAPGVREVVDAFALAEAGRLTCDYGAARKSYADVIAQCTILLAGGADQASRPILLAAFAEADEQQRQLPAASGDARQQFSSQEALKLLASAKARADGLAGRGEVVRARLAYRGLLKAGEVLAQRFLTEENRKAAEWVSGRARRALASLPDTAEVPAIAHEPIEQAIKDIVAGVRADIRPQPSGTLKVEWGKFPIEPTDPAKLCPGAIRANAHPQPTDSALSWTLEERPGFPPPFGVSVATASTAGVEALLATARKGLQPSTDPASTYQLSAVQPVGVDATEAALAAFRKGLRPYSDAVVGIRVEGPDDLVMAVWRNGIKAIVADLARDDAGVSLEASKSLLEWLAAHGVGSDVVGELALAFSRRRAPASQGAITMGTTGPTTEDLRLVALDACVTLLQTAPERDRGGGTAERAFRLAAELGRLAELEAMLKERLGSEKPGLLGPLLFRVLRGQKRDGEAYALLAKMSEDPERFLAPGRATSDVLLQGFEHCVSKGLLTEAEGRLKLLESYELAGEADRWLALARAHVSGGQGKDEARRLAGRATAKSPDKETKTKVQVFLASLDEQQAQRDEKVKTSHELALMAEEARVNPRLYFALAVEYRRARMYVEARNAYDFAARRFDNLGARRALIETYFDEGKTAEGAQAAAAFFADHPGSGEARALMDLAEQWCLRKGNIGEAARLWLHVVERNREGTGGPYADKLAALLVKAGRDSEGPMASSLAGFAKQTRGSRVWPAIEARIEAREKAIAQLVPPWLITFDAVAAGWKPWWEGLGMFSLPQLSPVGLQCWSGTLPIEPFALVFAAESIRLPPLPNPSVAVAGLKPWEVRASVEWVERPMPSAMLSASIPAEKLDIPSLPGVTSLAGSVKLLEVGPPIALVFPAEADEPRAKP